MCVCVGGGGGGGGEAVSYAIDKRKSVVSLAIVYMAHTCLDVYTYVHFYASFLLSAQFSEILDTSFSIFILSQYREPFICSLIFLGISAISM